MKIVMLSGGSGKRLWPMSNDSRSKQFLKVLDGGSEEPISMLQRNWGFIRSCSLQSDTYICASKSQREMIEAQIGNVPFIEEPERRDTFPAIALAALYLSDVIQCPDDEPIVIMPIDPMVDPTYFEHLQKLPLVLHQSNASLALMGVQPTEPTDKYGYICPEDQHSIAAPWKIVNRFVEKPNPATAIQLIRDGALWNCGVFCFNIGFIKDVLDKLSYPSTYRNLLDQFSSLTKSSFDYQVVENAARIAVLPFDGLWKDLGTWDALVEEISTPFIGKGTSKACEETQVINELGIPVITAGLNNAVVVATPDGILVTDKGHSQDVKDLVSTFSGRPMYEERHWGKRRVVDYQKLPDGTESLINLVELDAGKSISYHRHMKRSEVWTVLSGRGQLIIDDKLTTLEPGDVVHVYSGQWHAIKAIETLLFTEVQLGAELVEEDVIRRFLEWDEAYDHVIGTRGR